MSESVVSFSDVLRAASAGLLTLAPESVGYVVLAVADSTLRQPTAPEEREIWLSQEGVVRVDARRGVGSADAARAVRGLLARALEACPSTTPSLRAVSRVRDTSDPAGLVAELEAALIPVNRAAARRALARLARDTERARTTAAVSSHQSAAGAGRADAAAPVDSARRARVAERLSSGPSDTAAANVVAAALPPGHVEMAEYDELSTSTPSEILPAVMPSVGTRRGPALRSVDVSPAAPNDFVDAIAAPNDFADAMTRPMPVVAPAPQGPKSGSVSTTPTELGAVTTAEDAATPRAERGGLSAGEATWVDAEVVGEATPSIGDGTRVSPVTSGPRPGLLGAQVVPPPDDRNDGGTTSPVECAAAASGHEPRGAPTLAVSRADAPLAITPAPRPAPGPSRADALLAAFVMTDAHDDRHLAAQLKRVAGLEPTPTPVLSAGGDPALETSSLGAAMNAPESRRQEAVVAVAPPAPSAHASPYDFVAPRAPRATRGVLTVLLMAGLILVVVVWLRFPGFFGAH